MGPDDLQRLVRELVGVVVKLTASSVLSVRGLEAAPEVHAGVTAGGAR